MIPDLENRGVVDCRRSMIQSLRNRLEELEKGEEPSSAPEAPRPRDEPFYGDFDGPSSTGGDVIPHARPIPRDTEVPPLSQPTSLAAGLAASAHQPAPAALRRCINVTTSESTPPSYEPRGLGPCSVERLMRPIDRAVDMRKGHDISEAPTSTGAGDQNIPRDAPPAGTSCLCDRSLGPTRWRLPLRRQAEGLVTLYFTRVQRMYPVLHERTFRRQYERLWQSVSGSSAGTAGCSGLCKHKNQGEIFPATVYTVFSLASLFESRTPATNILQAEDYFRLAQEIDLLDILDSEVQIELVQLGLLMGFYLLSTERFSKCWNITGLTIRMAQNMGLQLDLNEARRKGLVAPNASQVDCEMRSRVWYGCVLLDR